MFENIRETKLKFVDFIVLASYYFFCLFLFLSLAGLFKKEFIGIGVVVFLLLLAVFCRKIIFRKYYLYFFILPPIFFVGILLFLGSFAGDAISYWLPWAREIVLQQEMPDFLLNSYGWLTSQMPLMPLFFAGIFSFFGFKASLATILPLFFVSATLLLLYQWFQEKGINKNYIFFVVFLVLTNPMMMRFGWDLHPEAFILFFFTAFFYYLEKHQRTGKGLYLLLIFLSFALAIASKMTGLILILPLVLVIFKKRPSLKWLFYLFLISLPLIIWFARSYLIYGNPVFPFLNNLFKGPYYELYLAVNQITQQTYSFFSGGVSTKLATLSSVFLLFCPFIILSFYGFWKERKVWYAALFISFLLAIIFVANWPEYYRYLIPFLGVLIIYALAGLEKIKSRVFLSFIFFINLWGLLSTKIFFSQSEFLSLFEKNLAVFSQVAQFIYGYGLILAIALSLFFYFFISQKSSSKYLLLLLICSYLVKSSVVQIGSWLNIWLPTLFLIFIVLIWGLLMKLREPVLRKSVISFIIILLVLNSWGLTAMYFLAHGEIAFPNLKEAYGILPEVAQTLGKLEDENRDFYIFVTSSGYLAWYHNYKVVTYRTPLFHVITNLKYRENLSAKGIHDLFQRSNIKYVAENSEKEEQQPFFDKVKSHPNLFEPVGESLWRVVKI